ncbi:MAG: hypothetical protein ACX94C_11825 [Phycisphaerales bacterium]
MTKTTIRIILITLAMLASATLGGEPAFRLLFFMPGTPEHQEQFWNEAIVDTGLAPHADIGKQINALSSHLYSGEVLGQYGNDPDAVAARFYDWTRWRMDDGWLPEGKKYTHLMIDTEPQKRHLPGDDPMSSWGWLKIRNGYDADDTAYLNAMLEGASKATGLPVGHYHLPRLFDKPIGDEYDARLDSARGFMERTQWVWQHEYADEAVTVESSQEALAAQISQRLKLRRYGLPVYNAIWPGRYLTEEELLGNRAQGKAGAYEHVLWSTKRWGDEYLIIWLDLDHPADLRVHTHNMRVLAPMILEVMGVE